MTSEADRSWACKDPALLDTARDPRFDRIVEIAQHAFDVPIAALSILDADRLRFKAQRGLPFDQLPRGVAVCEQVIRSDSIFVVEDASRDRRFARNPLVLGPPHIRFYAGAPLTAEESGVRIGALFVMSDRPRRFSGEERKLLRLLAEEACDEMGRHALQSRLSEELRRGRERNRMLLDLSRELVRKDKVSRQVYRIARIGGWELDFASNALEWSDEVYALLDVGRDFPLELHAALGLIPDEHRQAAADAVANAAASGAGFELEVPICTKSGSARWLRVLAETDQVRGRLFGTVQDVTARREIEAELKHVATTDGLTGLSNRTSFLTAVEAALGEGDPARPTALLLLDLDGFKEVNDLQGHDAGDRLLTVTARRLRSCLRRREIIGRLGGDEFGVLLRERTIVEIAGMARLMLEAATAPVHHLGHSTNVGASVGIALFPNDASGATELMKHADIALYAVKRAGGDSFQFYVKELAAEVESRAIIMREVRAGLGSGQFTVAYQPVMNLREARLAGVEALLRWNHPQHGLLPASAFFAALEEPVLGRRLSDAAREIAIEQYARWQRHGLFAGRLGLNASAGQLRDVEFADRLFESLSRHGLSPSQIVLEITEGVLLERGVESIARRISTLHDAGVRIALDDFGTGYASLTHLRQFPVDLLKIDASFVRSMATADASRTIVKTVIDMAHGLGMRAVAEGVEGPEVDALLRLMGCDFGQGYFYGRPMLAKDLAPLLGADDAAPQRVSRVG